MIQPLPIDWTRVLEDIAWQLGEPSFAFPQVRTPAGTRVVACRLKVSRSTMLRWIDGSEPKYSDGESILRLWCSLTGKAAEFAPRARRSLSAAKVA